MQTLVFCTKCTSRICRAKDGFYVLGVFTVICEDFVRCNRLQEIYLPNDIRNSCHKLFFEALKILEHHNFIVTTESGIEHIQIKPNGIIIEESNGFRFCLGEKGHR